MRPEEVDTLMCWLRILVVLLRLFGPLVQAIAHRIEPQHYRRHIRRKQLQKDFDHA